MILAVQYCSVVKNVRCLKASVLFDLFFHLLPPSHLSLSLRYKRGGQFVISTPCSSNSRFTNSGILSIAQGLAESAAAGCSSVPRVQSLLLLLLTAALPVVYLRKRKAAAGGR
jgi:hypothetical protein